MARAIGHALLLAARELGRRVVFPALQPDGIERARGHGMSLGGGFTAIDQRQLDVLQRGRARQQVEALEDEAEVATRRRARSSRLSDCTWTPLYS